MITMPQSPITDHSFKKWGAIRVEESDGESEYYYWIIPIPKLEEFDVSERPTLISTANDEWKNMEIKEGEYLISLFENVPMMETEEEIELLYKILTKQNLTK
jgi:hypothetical protein